MRRDRFAPSPTGFLHLGHALSALTVWESSARQGGEFILRIDDLDVERSRREFVAAIFDDLTWLGLSWRQPVMFQSQRREAYAHALNRLIDLGICFPCGCTRADIRAAQSAPQEGSDANTRSRVYPGTCRNRKMHEIGDGDSVRLNMEAAIKLLGGEARVSEIGFCETGLTFAGEHYLNAGHLLQSHGDVVLARKGLGASYHLSVIIDDDAQQVTHVTRGEDLFGATSLHRLLQELLSVKPPVWNHHRLVRDADGNRLAKRSNSTTLVSLRRKGCTPADIRHLVNL
ncbi:MAG: tRNA glutamyl-Q(34) synthetase GluQRS [Rhodobacteraceae bacterium]|nr:tRNA glutamyl-Q(34) synthetase GluQRS [Paracoccaceae bacterium]